MYGRVISVLIVLVTGIVIASGATFNKGASANVEKLDDFVPHGVDRFAKQGLPASSQSVMKVSQRAITIGGDAEPPKDIFPPRLVPLVVGTTFPKACIRVSPHLAYNLYRTLVVRTRLTLIIL